jgi:hypothetical protein
MNNHVNDAGQSIEVKDALHEIMNPEPAPLYYRCDPGDRNEEPVILEQQRGGDALVDQFRDHIEAAQAIV